MNALAARGIAKSFGGRKALDGVTFAIDYGELVGLIGPNGSGKTTLLNILSGHLVPDAGEILLDGKPMHGMTPVRAAHSGILRMFQLTRVFRRMSALDNLVTAGCALGLEFGAAQARARELVEELRLEHVATLDAGNLSGGQQKLLEFGCCFMVPPKIALLDEPFAAVHPTMKEIMAEFIRRRHAAGQTVLVVSHDMPVIVELCRSAICMNAGVVLAAGETREVLANHQVIEAYLGGEAA
ncbi:MAG: ATP-binding cassette domain-containing protein [Burkholderiales bacterium]|nr:ATP-binding cassette domain-containing protein [Burkholderiales bacterium]